MKRISPNDIQIGQKFVEEDSKEIFIAQVRTNFPGVGKILIGKSVKSGSRMEFEERSKLLLVD